MFSGSVWMKPCVAALASVSPLRRHTAYCSISHVMNPTDQNPRLINRAAGFTSRFDNWWHLDVEPLQLNAVSLCRDDFLLKAVSSLTLWLSSYRVGAASGCFWPLMSCRTLGCRRVHHGSPHAVSQRQEMLARLHRSEQCRPRVVSAYEA